MRLVSMLAITAAVTFAAAQHLDYTPDPQWQAPPQATAKHNPLAAKPRLAAGGGKVFQRECSNCHGDHGEGLGNAADLQLPIVQDQTDGVLFWKITNGNARRGMPSFSSLPELQRWQLVLYIRSLVEQRGSQPKR